MRKTFTNHFKTPPPKKVDFFDIPLDEDVEAFICPFLIANNRHHPAYNAVYLQLTEFLKKLNRDFVVANNRLAGLDFLSFLHEPNEYHLGYSDENKGKAISKSKAEIIFDALRNNRFARRGTSVTNEAHNVLLLVKGIGQDIMSDVIANVCRNIFAHFTEQQCLLYSISTHAMESHSYNATTGKWETNIFNLPIYNGKAVILVPKNLISGGRAYTNGYNWFIAKNYLSNDLLDDRIVKKSGRLITTMKDGTRKAIVKIIYKLYSKPKDELIEFVLRYQGSLDAFRDYAKEHYPELDLNGLQ